jgi:Coenzyme PQQ synthesis protein D (PqqD)
VKNEWKLRASVVNIQGVVFVKRAVMQTDCVYEKNNMVVSRPLKPEVLVLPLKAGSVNLSQAYLLNETAGRMWELIDGKRTVTEIITLFVAEYEVSHAEALEDFAQLVTDLKDLDMLKQIVTA